MQNFAPLSATVGGLLIGLATTILWVVNGRTAGIERERRDPIPKQRVLIRHGITVAERDRVASKSP